MSREDEISPGLEPGEREQRMTLAAGWLALAIGAAALIGWWFRLPRLVKPLHAGSAMALNTACAFVLSGAALVAAVSKRRAAGKWLAVLAVVVAGATMFGRALGLDGSIGAWLSIANPFEARMAPFTGLGLVGVAIVILALDRAGKSNPQTDVAIAAAAVTPFVLGLIPMLSRALGMINLSPWGPHFAAMAPQTAVGLSVLGSACLLLVWQRAGAPESAGRHLILPAAASMAICLVCWALFDAMLTAARDVVGEAQALVLRRDLISSWLVCMGFVVASLTAFWLELRKRLRAEAILRSNEAGLVARLEQHTAQLRTESAENRQTHIRLSESELRFRSTFEQAAVGLAHIAADGRFIRANDRFCDITGYRRDQLNNVSLCEITYPPDLKADQAQAAALLRGEIDKYSRDKRYVHRDGHLIWVHLTMSLVRIADGSSHYFIAVVEDISLRKQAEQRLMESELRYRWLFDASLVGIVELRLPGEVLVANPAFYNLIGWTGQEFAESGKTLPSITPVEWMEFTKSHIRNPAEAGKPAIFEKEYFRKDGTRVPVLIGLSFAGKQRGEAVAFVVDLTLLKRTEERLRVSEGRFRVVVEAAPSAMIMSDARSCITMVNAQAEKLFGYSREELLGQPIELLVPGAARTRHRQWSHEYLENPVATRMGAGRDLQGLRKDGAEVPVEIGLSPITTGEGEFVLASIVDITERRQMHEQLRTAYGELEVRVLARTKELSTANETLRAEIEDRRRAEQALQESEAAFRTLAESVPQMVWITDPGGLNVYFNQRWTAYTGLSMQESSGTRWDTPFHPDDKQPARNAWTQAVATGETYRIECRLRGTDGQYRWFLTKGVPMRDAGGRILHWFGTCTDIDDLKRAQEAQRKSLLEKETLLKEVHHRVKNNLQVICSLLSMQLSDPADSFYGPLNDAYSRVQAMALIHEEIYQSETLADLDLSVYVELLSARLFEVYCIDQPRIRLELQVEPVRITVDDAVPCGLILNELLSNALKHAFPGRREGHIRIALKPVGSRRVQLQVADDGVGLPPDFRLEDARSLGLQVLQTLIAQLEADLVVSGDAGTSVTFSWQPGKNSRNPSVPGL